MCLFTNKTAYFYLIFNCSMNKKILNNYVPIKFCESILVTILNINLTLHKFYINPNHTKIKRFRTIPFFVSFLLSLSVMACLTCACFTLTLWRKRRLKFNIFL